MEGFWAEGRGASGLPERWAAVLPGLPYRGLETVNTSGAGDASCAALLLETAKGIECERLS
jgi:hypothetical protein